MAAGDPNMKDLAKQAITLSNFWALTHPSMPNYVASVSGEHFGIDNDDFIVVPSNVSTVVDLLDTKGISYGEYLESSPYAGFEGHNFSSHQANRNDYVRKHNPLVNFESVSSNATRLSTLKNFTSFDSDLAAQTLPQWMFIVPNMTNDGHDTSITVASQWSSDFIKPLLSNDYFMKDTLIVLTFDEDETYPERNLVYTLLLGGAIPTSLHGTEDNTFYNHYSMLSTVQANWGLPSLGRWDCGANILDLVANKTGYVNAAIDTTSLIFNTSYPGPLSNKAYDPRWPVPDTNGNCGARGVLDSVVSTWGKEKSTIDYENPYPFAKGGAPNNVGAVLATGSQGSTPSPTSSTANEGTLSSSSLGFVIAFTALVLFWV